MKKTIIYLVILFPILFMSACREEGFTDTIFPDTDEQSSEFDKWLYENYVKTYNIRFIYKWDWTEASHTSALTPPELEKAQKMAQFVRTSWLDAYLEVTDSLFLRQFAPKFMLCYGPTLIKVDGFQALASASGGVQVNFYDINSFNVADKSWMKYYVTTVHHEYMHILNQVKKMPVNFKTYSQSDYLYADFKDSSTVVANQRGFVTQYARMNPMEDFAETYCTYLSMDSKTWEAFLVEIAKKAPGARLKIEKKVADVRSYIRNEFNIDLEALRAVVLQKQKDMEDLSEDDFIVFN
jgi:substrate import-associated zinc metallohydrolase lipoprotein